MGASQPPRHLGFTHLGLLWFFGSAEASRPQQSRQATEVASLREIPRHWKGKQKYISAKEISSGVWMSGSKWLSHFRFSLLKFEDSTTPLFVVVRPWNLT